MQTTKERCIEFLTDRGLWPNEAEAVLEKAKPEIEVGGYRMTWERPASEYPVELYAVIGLILSRNAVEWIDRNKPMHFARMMFVPQNPVALTAP